MHAAECARGTGSALEALRALGCFRASMVARLYSEAILEHAEQDPGTDDMLSQVIAGSHTGGSLSY